MILLFYLIAGIYAACDKGQYNNVQLNACQDCPSGYYGDGENLIGCYECNVGTYQSLTGQQNCLSCPSGKYQPSKNATQCLDCDQYIYFKSSCVETCPDGTWPVDKVCEYCDAGYFSIENSSTCTKCLPGEYKESANDKPCKTCPFGWVSVESRTSCEECADGQGVSNSVCETCLAGKYSDGATCRHCSIGKFQNEPGQTTCKACLAGTYQDTTGQTSCSDCAAGFFSGETGVFECSPCPLGFGTDQVGQSSCAPCVGAETVQGVCQNCAPGMFINDKACEKCPRGFVSAADGTKCNICPSNQYANKEKNVCEACPAGLETNIMNNPGSWKCCVPGDCDDCPAGKHRIDNQCINCPPGYVSRAALPCRECDISEGEYTSDGLDDCDYCAEGQESDGTQCTDCGTGKYEFKSECLQCPRGWFSKETRNPVCEQCPMRKSTVNSGSVSETDCTIECTNSQMVDSFGDCQQCDLGKYVVGRICVDCPLGTHKDTVAALECRNCPSGFNTDTTGNIDCYVCPPGQQCGCPWGQYGTDGNCQDCPVGYSSTGELECTACPLAKYQDSIGQGKCLDCPAGTFGDVLGATQCKDCPTGQFQLFTGAGACEDCPRGRFGGGIECANCTAGKSTLQTGSISDAQCLDCPAGKMEEDRLCIDCFEGTYQNKTGSVICEACPTDKWSSPGTVEESECFGTKGLTTYTFGNIEDSKEVKPYSTLCELRANFVMVCPGCTCDADARNGFWAGPMCDECRRGFATRFCTSICPGYDGQHDSTICNGNGRCWFGRERNGLCYCGGHHILDSSSENVFVDVQYCPAGKICPGYGVEKMSVSTYIPLYYLINYRQYTSFVLQMSKYTPERGHMWFKRFSPSKAFENTCTVCNSKYLDTALTEIGYWNKDSDYVMFPLQAQTKNGFHGENCQYECAVCLNGGKCVHSPHPYRYSYTIKNTYKQQSSAIYPTTTCLCSSNVYDAAHMCCPNGFQPYVYYGKRATNPYARFTTIPYVTSVDNNIDLGYYRDIDVSLEEGISVKYVEPDDGMISVGRGSTIVNDLFSEVGPYNKHVYHGTTKEICRACPGLFGKGIRAVDNFIETEQAAEDYWWNFPASAGSKKCQGQGVCDFYKKEKETAVDFMGDINDYALLHRGRMCKSASIEGFVDSNDGNPIETLEDCVKYAQDKSAFFVGWAPEFYMGGTMADFNGELGSEEAAILSSSGDALEGWVRNTDKNGLQFSTLRGELPAPDTDSTFEIHARVVKRCIAFVSCIELRPLKSTAYRAFNIYTVEKGRGDERLDVATFDRFDTCFTYTKNYDHDPEKVGGRQKFGLYLTQTYTQGDDPFLGGLCPKGYFCTQNSDGTGFKEACPVGYYQPLEGQTRTHKDTHCSRLSSNVLFDSTKTDIVQTQKNTITSLKKCEETLIGLGYNTTLLEEVNIVRAPYGCYLESTTMNGTAIPRFNTMRDYRSIEVGNQQKQYVETECFSYFSDDYFYKCVLHEEPCQPNLATKPSNDYVDDICLRCPRDSYSAEGSYECTRCPPGRVKKVSGQFDERSIEIYNTPRIPKPFWYYISNEGGTESDDCALVPPSVIHVPGVYSDWLETPADEQFLPVVSCPYGYSSQPGSYIIEDIFSMQTILQVDEDVMVPPYINIEGDKKAYESPVPCSCIPPTLEEKYVSPEDAETCAELNTLIPGAENALEGVTNPGSWHGCLRFDMSFRGTAEYLNDPSKIYNYPTQGVKFICQKVIRDQTLMEEFVSTYCYQCPGDSMTGPASSMCTTCTANLIKKNMKIGLQKLVMNSEARMYHCGEDNKPIPVIDTNPTAKTFAQNVFSFADCPIIERNYTDVSIDVDYKKELPARYYLQTLEKTWPSQNAFTFIKDPLLPGDSIELTITDCILACESVFTKPGEGYNMSNGVLPVRVGYAKNSDERQYCVCNEGAVGVADAYPIASNGDEDSSCNGLLGSGLTECRSRPCYDIIQQNQQTIQNVDCIRTGAVNIIWYESVIIDDWDLDEFPLCGLCKPGTKYTGSQCEDCGAGTYTSDMIESMKDVCVDCPAGFFQKNEGRTGCSECRPGFFQPDPSSIECYACPAGYYQNDFQKISCKHCEQGKYQLLRAQPICINCAQGYYEASTANDSTVFDDTTKTWNNVNDQPCDACPKGYSQNERGQGRCKDCPSGWKQPGEAELQCIDCAPGKYQFEMRQTQCIACPTGYAQDKSAQPYCNPCSAASFPSGDAIIPPDNSAIVDTCSSQTGCVWSSSTEESRAPKGAEFQDDTGELLCKACPSANICTVDGELDKCGPGHVMPAGHYTQACYKCDKSTYAPPEDQSACEDCLAPSIVDGAHTSCTSCSPSQGKYPKPDKCGITKDSEACRECHTCKMTEYVEIDAENGNKCVPCAAATPIRQTEGEEAGVSCTTCADGKYWSGTDEGECVDCPATKFKEISDGCSDCGKDRRDSNTPDKLHWYKDAKDGESTKGELNSNNEYQIKYTGPWQTCCWDTEDYVKMGGWIVTPATESGGIFAEGDDLIRIKVKERGGGWLWEESIEWHDDSVRKCLAQDKIFYVEWEWFNGNEDGDFEVYVYNSVVYKSEPKHTNVLLQCGSYSSNGNRETTNAKKIKEQCPDELSGGALASISL